MSQLQDALQKVKEGHKSALARASKKPGQADGAAVPVAKPASIISQSALAKDAKRIALDPDVLEKNRVVAASETPGMSSAYKMLRTRVLQRMRTNNWTRLAISSARPSAGKTLTAINTAISLSFEQNQRVILVDLDLRRPTIARYLGINQQYGLSDYLSNDVPIEKVIVRPSIERLLIVPNFQADEQSSEHLSSPRMVELVERLSSPSNSTIVIFDLPPILDADDMLAFSPLFDALLVVVSQSETRRVDLQKSFELLSDINVLGVVLNKSRGKDDAPSYY
jgi:protein-tyrosine kinase